MDLSGQGPVCINLFAALIQSSLFLSISNREHLLFNLDLLLFDQLNCLILSDFDPFCLLKHLLSRHPLLFWLSHLRLHVGVLNLRLGLAKVLKTIQIWHFDNLRVGRGRQRKHRSSLLARQSCLSHDLRCLGVNSLAELNYRFLVKILFFVDDRRQVFA